MYGASFEWRKKENPEEKGFTLWSPTSQDTKYFEPSEKDFMINFRVDDLEALIELLKKDNIKILNGVQTFEYGKFAHIMDIEGNKIELWEPNDEVYEEMISKKT